MPAGRTHALQSTVGRIDPGNLDSKNGEAVMELLGEIHTSGATIGLVTHDSRYASHAERTIHLFDGRVVEQSLAVQ